MIYRYIVTPLACCTEGKSGMFRMYSFYGHLWPQSHGSLIESFVRLLYLVLPLCYAYISVSVRLHSHHFVFITTNFVQYLHVQLQYLIQEIIVLYINMYIGFLKSIEKFFLLF